MRKAPCGTYVGLLRSVHSMWEPPEIYEFISISVFGIPFLGTHLLWSWCFMNVGSGVQCHVRRHACKVYFPLVHRK